MAEFDRDAEVTRILEDCLDESRGDIIHERLTSDTPEHGKLVAGEIGARDYVIGMMERVNQGQDIRRLVGRKTLEAEIRLVQRAESLD